MLVVQVRLWTVPLKTLLAKQLDVMEQKGVVFFVLCVPHLHHSLGLVAEMVEGFKATRSTEEN